MNRIYVDGYCIAMPRGCTVPLGCDDPHVFESVVRSMGDYMPKVEPGSLDPDVDYAIRCSKFRSRFNVSAPAEYLTKVKASKTPEEHVALTYWFCKNAVSSDSPLPEVEAYMGALRDVIGLILLTYYANGLLSAKITAFLSIYEEALAKRRLVF